MAIALSGSLILSGSIIVSGSITSTGTISMSGSIASASYAVNATSASYALNATTGAYANTSTSASYALNATTFNGLASSIFATTGSNTFIGNQVISGSLTTSGSITATGTITAQTLVVQTITSSVVYSSGSNVFGNAIGNTQTFTGSVLITGSLALVGNITSNGTAVVLGSGTSGYLPKFTGTSTIGNSLIWDNGTNVGIGNTNTSYTLDVSGTGRFTSTLLVSGAATFSSSVTAGGDISANAGSSLRLYRPDSSYPSSSWFWNIYMDSSNLLSFAVNGGTPKMIINASGNVGIGTFSPTYKLDVSGANGTYLRVTETNSAVGYGSGVRAVAGSVDFGFVVADGLFSLYDYGGGGRRLSITSGGNVLIGSSTDGNGKLQVTGSDNTIIANWKSTSGMIQFYPYFSAYGGSIIQSLNGSGASYAPLRFELTTMTVAGNQTVTGTKSFAIDHPLDNTKTLFHYSTESPKADLIYRGKANLINGKVEINIDISSKMTNGTFVALCREVQCFTTNETGWDMVKGKVNGNILLIESNNQNSTDEISWMVIGERYDESIKNSNMLDEDGDLIVEKLKPSEPITN